MTRVSVRGWLAFAAGCMLVLSAGSVVHAQAQMVLKIATVNSGDNPRNISANEFARVVGEASKGKIKGEVYINNQLARGEGAMLEGIQLGTIDIAPVGSAPIGGIFEPAFLPLDLPFLWTSREQAWRVMDGPIGARTAQEDGGQGREGPVLGRRLGLPQHALQCAADRDAGGHEGPDDPRAGIADLYRDDEGARRQSGADAVWRSLSRDEAGHGRRHGACRYSPRCPTNSTR